MEIGLAKGRCLRLDYTDMSILHILAQNGRASQAELASRLGLSRQTISDRMERLLERGVLLGFVPLISAEAVGAGLTAFIGVTVEKTEQCRPFLDAVRGMDEVLECHHVAGDDSYLLKVRTSGTAALERLITDGLKGIPGVIRTRTTVVLSTAKEKAVPPLPAPSVPSAPAAPATLPAPAAPTTPTAPTVPPRHA